MSSFQFTRMERLKSRKLIGQVFSEGKSFPVFPLRLVFAKVEGAEHTESVQVGFTVPKKAFRSAVQRNRIKRQMREAYRLRKNVLLQGMSHTTDQFAWMLLYTAKEPLPFAQIEEAMGLIIKRFLKKNIPAS
ncbi:MAG: ribonuclease P protein component [Saprospirales bacterium]|nr:ribonuclease P protein component [Saprospirales bacterium]